MQRIRKTLFVMLALAAAPVWAHDGAHIRDAWVRATVPQQRATGAFMTLDAALDSKLVRATSPVSDHVEIHEMVMEDDVMKMRQIPSIAIPAGQVVELKPGGYHIMLLELKQQIRAGDQVPLTLVFEHSDGRQERIDVQAQARPLAGKPAGQHRHDPAHAHGDHKH